MFIISKLQKQIAETDIENVYLLANSEKLETIKNTTSDFTIIKSKDLINSYIIKDGIELYSENWFINHAGWENTNLLKVEVIIPKDSEYYYEGDCYITNKIDII